VVLSWLTAFNVVNTRHPLVNGIGQITYRLCEPALRRIRRFLPNLGRARSVADRADPGAAIRAQPDHGIHHLSEHDVAPGQDAPMPFCACPAGVRVRLKVTPKAKREQIGGLLDEPDGWKVAARLQ